MMLLKRVVFAAALALSASSAALAQVYPARPVKIVAPFAAGGLADVLARSVAEKLSAALGGPFIVENRAGAGGNIGADAVAKAEPDGHTLLMSSTGILTINASLYPTMPFDPVTAFAPVSLVADMPMLLLVGNAVPARNLSEFIALAKQEPGKFFFGSPGNGTTGHLAMEMFQGAAGVKINHVPYKSAAEAVTAAVSGQTTGMFDNPPTVMAQLKAGTIRALGVASGRRMPQLPEVPTLAEAGLPGFEASSWFGLVAPARTPPAVVERLNAAVVSALKEPDMQRRFDVLGARLVGDSPDQFAEFIRAERVKWDRIVRSANVKLN